MQIKTFPLRFIETDLDEIRIIAKQQNKTITQFIVEAIDEKIKREQQPKNVSEQIK